MREWCPCRPVRGEELEPSRSPRVSSELAPSPSVGPSLVVSVPVKPITFRVALMVSALERGRPRMSENKSGTGWPERPRWLSSGYRRLTVHVVEDFRVVRLRSLKCALQVTPGGWSTPREVATLTGV